MVIDSEGGSFMKDLFSNKNFLNLLYGRVFSMLADSMMFMALLKWLENETGNPNAYTWFYFAFYLPAAFFAIPIGAWVEKKYLQKVIIMSDIIRATIMLFLIIALPHLSYLWIFVYLVIEGTLSLFFFPANQSLLPHLVSKKSIVEGNSVLQLSYIVMKIVGFGLASFFISISFSISYILAICVTCLLLSAFFTRKIRPYIKNQQQDIQNYKKMLLGGVKYILNRRNVKNLFIIFALAWLVASSIDVVILHFINNKLHLGVEYFSYIAGAVFIGMILGAILSTYLYKRIDTKWLLISPLFIYSVTIETMNFADTIWTTIPFFLLGGFSLGIFEVLFVSYLQENTSEQQYARTFSIYNMIFNTMPVFGLLWLGYFLKEFNFSLVVHSISLVLLIVGLIGLIFLPELNKNE